MADNYPQAVTYLTAKTQRLATVLLRLSLCTYTLTGHADSSDATLTPASNSALSPYSATYNADLKGFSTTLTRQLQVTDDQQWLLSNKASIFLVGFNEQTTVQQLNNTIQPLQYRYQNAISSKRNKSIDFHWDQLTAETIKGKSEPVTLTLPTTAYDQLSFQLQLRMLLLNPTEPFTEQRFTIVDTGKLKTYSVKFLAEEWLDTPLGKLLTVKLEQTRPGKTRRTLIWMAKDWQYLLVKIQRFKNEKQEHLIELNSATLDGKILSTNSP
jgi:hypothetical protein